MIRSCDVITINGITTQRWAAEKAGLIPVSLCRCPHSYAIDWSEGWLVKENRLTFDRAEDFQELFHKSKYSQPTQARFTGFIGLEDERGTKCAAFWPQCN